MLQVLRNLFFALILSGLLYPSVVFMLSKIFPKQAEGSLLTYNGRIVGSKLLGQKFYSTKYFHSRPDLFLYYPLESNGNVYDQYLKNPKLVNKIENQIKKIRKKYNFSNKTLLPSDMVLASGSGVDPHISFENAVLQLHYVAKNRNIPVQEIYPLLYKAITKNFVGLWGNTVVNVLQLNLLLDNLENGKDENL